MKQLLMTFIVCSVIASLTSIVSGPIFAQLQYIDPDNPNITQDIDDVIDTTDVGGPQWQNTNSIRAGTRFPIASPDNSENIGVIDQGEIQTYEQGQLQTLTVVKRMLNYFLGFLGLVALMLFIYTGIQIVTAGEDDSKYKEATSQFRKVAMAIGGIGLSWFIVTFLFYVIGLIVA